jgi:hypothetical protein
MFEKILQAFLMQGVLPEVLAIIKEHFDKTGQIISLEELQIRFQTRADSVITNGTDWLNAHK